MIKMGVKKKHESGFFEDTVLKEPAKVNRHQQSDWYHFHRETVTREPAAMAKKHNGDSISNSTGFTNHTTTAASTHNHSQRQMDLLDLARVNETDNHSPYGSPKHHTANHYRSANTNNSNHSANQHHYQEPPGRSGNWYVGRSNGHRNNGESGSQPVVTHVVNHDAIVISDEDDEDDDDDEGDYAHNAGE